jgi:release factor glutamine methyltransferase
VTVKDRQDVRAAGMSVDGARRELARDFREHGIDTPELDARLLVGHALGLDHAALAAQSGRALTQAETDVVAALGRRRRTHEPVARIIGEKEFWGLTLRLGAETLVPRPETETVVEAALEALGREGRPLRIADLGTGTGALLLALLSELPAAHGVGTDTSLPALRCAQSNAAALGRTARAAFVASDYGTALAGSFDLVVSNPPYVRHGDIATLAPEVRRFDPPRALDGGADGLDGYRAIAADARRMISPSGILVVELGAGQRVPVTTLFEAAGLVVVTARTDLSGTPRALVVRALPGTAPGPVPRPVP